MGAGGSHPQATMMQGPWATYKCPSAEEGQTANDAPPADSQARANKQWHFRPHEKGSVKLDPSQPHEAWRREAWLTKLWTSM